MNVRSMSKLINSGIRKLGNWKDKGFGGIYRSIDLFNRS
jgi:hypothetical protein